MRHVGFRHPGSPGPRKECFDCGALILDGPPYERITECVSVADGLRITSVNMCRACWLVYQTRCG